MEKIKIESINAREIISGRGIPTVEVEIITNNGIKGIASSPSGASTSSYEAVEIRDGNKRFMGKGVLKAVRNIEELIAPEIIGKNIIDQYEIDQILIQLDGTKNKSKIGGNATTAVSAAISKAAAEALKIPLYKYLGGINSCNLPILCPNVLSGSKYAGNNLDFEDYLIVPFGFYKMKDAIRASIEVFYTLFEILKNKFGKFQFITAPAPHFKTTKEALDVIQIAIKQAGYEGKFGLGIDVAATLVYCKEEDIYNFKMGKMTKEDLLLFYKQMSKNYPIFFIEDAFNENDFEGFAELTKEVNCFVVGDDIFATNLERLIKGIKYCAGNAVLLKVNQAGTISETLRFAETAKNHNYTIISSPRSGETNDSFQADLAVAVGAKFMKIGAPMRGEQIEKYNRFLKIEDELADASIYWGKEFFNNKF